MAYYGYTSDELREAIVRCETELENRIKNNEPIEKIYGAKQSIEALKAELKKSIENDLREGKQMNVTLLEWPTDKEWYEVKRRALVTAGKSKFKAPDEEWKHKILEARHSPIRYLRFSFDIVCPYWVSVHMARHVHAQPYIRSQRNDRQSMYDRNTERQDAPIEMIYDVNAEELMVIANKRLCTKAAPETRALVSLMCEVVEDKCPEFNGFLVPACKYNGKCHEMYPCNRA